MNRSKLRQNDRKGRIRNCQKKQLREWTMVSGFAEEVLQRDAQQNRYYQIERNGPRPRLGWCGDRLIDSCNVTSRTIETRSISETRTGGDESGHLTAPFRQL